MTIAEACEFVTDGTHYTPVDVGHGVPFLTVKDVTDDALDFLGCSFISEDAYRTAKAGNSAPQYGDVLFSKDGTVGKVHVVDTDQPFAVLSSLAILRPNHDLVDSTYLGHVLRSPEVLDDALRRKTGSAIRRIILSDLKNVRIPLPPLPGQRRIAEILDKADALRAQRRAALAKLDALTQSIFVDMFGDPATNPKGWPWHRLGDVSVFYAGSTLPTGEDFIGQREGYFLLKVSDMNLPGNDVYLKICQQWSKEPGAPSSTCPRDSVVIPKRGGAIGTNKKRITTRPSVLDPNLMAIVPRPEYIELAFLYAWLLHLDLGAITSGSSVPQLNKRDLDPLSIPVPALDLQRDFAARVTAVRGVVTIQSTAASECDAVFMALQHRAFRGGL